MFCSKPTFDPSKDMNDLNGKVAIVTGGNTGIGYAVVKGLAKGGAKVYMAARNEAKAINAIATLEADGIKPGSVVWLKLELSNLDGVKDSADEFMSKETRLDILINNAAVLIETNEQVMINGVPEAMVTNHFGHFIFVQSLLPLLVETAKEPDADVRIINVSSSAHEYVPEVQFKSLEDLTLEHKGGIVPAIARYGHTKLANILFTNELQERFDKENIPILVVSLHPGLVLTSLGQRVPFPSIIVPISRLFLTSPDDATQTPLFAAASPIPRQQIEKYKACYFVPTCQIGKKAKQAESVELAKDLWDLTEKVLRENWSIQINTV